MVISDSTRHTPRVFISYAHEDAADARDIGRQLSDSNFIVWVDQWNLRLGDNIDEAIAKAIMTSDVAILLLSPAAVRSSTFNAETALVLAEELDKRGINVIPVLLAPCELPEQLRERQVVELATDDGRRTLINLLIAFEMQTSSISHCSPRGNSRAWLPICLQSSTSVSICNLPPMMAA